MDTWENRGLPRGVTDNLGIWAERKRLPHGLSIGFVVHVDPWSTPDCSIMPLWAWAMESPSSGFPGILRHPEVPEEPFFKAKLPAALSRLLLSTDPTIHSLASSIFQQFLANKNS